VVDRLLPALGEDGVLGLGESTHGSANAFEWKLDVVHELARRGLLAAFAIEDSVVAGLRIDEALQGRGDLDAALATSSSLLRTRTIREGLHRLVGIAAAVPPGRRARYLGIDVSAPHRTARALLDLGHEDAVLRETAARTALDPVGVAALDRLCARLEVDGHDRTELLARNLRRHLDTYLAAPGLERLHRRDAHMAHSLLEQRPSHGITVVWAHNEHVARNADNWGGPSMGRVLEQELGSGYVPVGVMCGEGEARAVDPSTGDDGYRAVPLPPLRPGTTDAALTSLGASFVTREEFTHPGPRRFLGWKIDTSLYEDPQAMRATFEVERPSTDFDAIAVLPASTADVSAEISSP
jgi:erythromycin esterase